MGLEENFYCGCSAIYEWNNIGQAKFSPPFWEKFSNYKLFKFMKMVQFEKKMRKNEK